MCDFGCVIRWSTFIYEFISIPFYISVMVVLILKRKSELQSCFFDLCISVGIADLGAIFSRLVLRSVPGLLYHHYPVTKSVIESVPFQTASSMIRGWGFYYAQVAGLLLLSFNRLTVVWMPLEYEGWWSDRKILLLSILQWISIFPFSLPQLHPCCWSKLLDNETFQSTMLDAENEYTFWTIDVLLESFVCTSILVLTWSTIVFKVSTHANQVTPVNMQQNVERRFTIMGLIICVLYIFLSMSWLYFWLYGSYMNDVHSHLTVIARDLFTCSNPYLLLAFSTKFRICYISVMTCGKIQLEE